MRSGKVMLKLFTRLTIPQESLIRSIVREGAEVFFYGLDQNDLPVIAFKDSVRMTEPFAILRSPRRRLRDGRNPSYQERTNVAPALPIRWFTDDELDVIEPDAHELLLSLARG